MSKGLIVASVVGLIVLGGGAYYLVSNNSSNSSSETTQSSSANTTANTAEPEKQQTSFSTLSKSGKAQKCDFEYSSEKGSGTGTMYTDGNGRGRMTATYNTSKGEGTSNTIVTADKAYGWFETAGKTTGFVYDKAKLEKATSNVRGATSGPDVNQNFSVNCSDWSVDESMLTPPTNVNFQTIPGM